MLDYFLIALLIIVLFALGYLAYRYAALRRAQRGYVRLLDLIVNGSRSLQDLPVDLRNIEDISNAVKTLMLTQQVQINRLDDERLRLAAVLDQITDGVLIAAAGGRIQFANPAAERLFEGGQILPGRTVVEALRHHQLVETWRRCQETGELQSETVEIPARRQFLQMVAIPDRHGGGSILLIQDLTRLRRLETVRRDFVSNVSHELRTPLASLRALTETLQEGALDDPPAARRFLGRIQTEVDALTQMAAELLELSRIESGQVPLDLKTIQVNKLLSMSSERMHLQAERAGLNLHLECPPDLPDILVDAPRMEQVLVNLIHNAIKFTPSGGDIVIKAERDDHFVCISVKDSGAGIPLDDLERIFERFYRVDRSRYGSGTGLGLSIARHLVEAHGGRIWAESREGSGSTFYFTVPISGE
jgi:two-component system, OmpR family, phosphate regulon sensor histidine kinase PhoR